MKPLPPVIEGVLFDLDGTLLDSAPDLYAALARQCLEEGGPPPPYAPVRKVVSRGARAVLAIGFPNEDEPAVAMRLPRYLALYQQLLGKHTQPFEGIEALLGHIEAQGMRWGIVTNKAAYLTEPLLQQMGWSERVAAVVAGDTLPVKKPDPAPLLLACQRAGINPRHALFVGDDQRDVVAGKSAGLYTVAAAWGYLDGGDPHAWGSDAVLDVPAALTALLRSKAAV